MKHSILVLNGPGLEDLRDDDGDTDRDLTLAEIRDACARLCESLELELDFRQTEDQDEMRRWIGKDSRDFDGIILNSFGCSRASTVTYPAYRPAVEMIAGLKKPIVEVHINNIFSEGPEITEPAHEPGIDMGLVCGLGLHGYLLAIRAIAHRLGVKEAPGA